MKKFILKIIAFLLPIPVFALIWVSFYGFPPPRVSNSISFNARIENLKQQHMIEHPGVLSLGSSICMNNLSSQLLSKHFNDSYLNTSAWALNMEEDFKFLKILNKLYHPRKLLITSNVFDFIHSEKSIYFEDVEAYLLNDKWSFLKRMNFKYFLKDSKNYHQLSNQINNYPSLNFDEYGGVNINGSSFEIPKEDWIGKELNSAEIDPHQYHYLDSISTFCLSQGIQLVFIESPFRYGYYVGLNENERELLAAHNVKILKLLGDRGQIVIQSSDILWKDEYFIDFMHMNALGADMFTNHLLEMLNKGKNN